MIRDALSAEIQSGVPFERRPFSRIAETIGASPAEVLDRVQDFHSSGILREISAILEGEPLGYESALVTGRVPEAQVERVAGQVSEHPTVTHNYLREHEYNLWFTVAVPEEMGLDRTLDVLSSRTGVRFQPLRRTATYKIGVRFRLDSLQNDAPVRRAGKIDRFRPAERQKEMLRALQRPLPLVEQPFETLAKDAGVGEEELLAFARVHLGGVIRRYGATLRHRKLGVRANGMIVWQVPEDRLEEAGTRLGESPQVSHCYARNPIEGFPYNLYSMVHGPDEASVNAKARELEPLVRPGGWRVLFSRQEFKKCRLRYFLPELDQWWREATA